MNSVQTRSIAPGFMGRVYLNAPGLWKGHPLLLWMDGFVILMLATFFPRYLGMESLVQIPICGLIYIQLRAFDEYGKADWATIKHFLRINLKDLAYLTITVSLMVVSFSLIIMLITAFHKNSGTVMAAHVGLAPKSSIVDKMPFAARKTTFTLLGWSTLFLTPFLSPLVFMTLLVGHRLGENVTAVMEAMRKNALISVLLILFSLLIAPVIGLLSVSVFIPEMGVTIGSIASESVALTIYLMVLTTSYLLSREMFEGREENRAFISE